MSSTSTCDDSSTETAVAVNKEKKALIVLNDTRHTLEQDEAGREIKHSDFTRQSKNQGLRAC